jgi:hypothetical protein
MIREPAVAGRFYPGNSSKLRLEIESYLSKPDSPLDAKAIVSPHAGYVYSGGVAGAVFSAVILPRRFIILGPNHTGMGAPLALAPAGDWRTPFGLAAVDAGLNRRLLEECPMLQEDRAAHAREHSLEVQIPFLQARLDTFSFSAICVGTADYTQLESLGHAIARVIRAESESILIVCSSDMNHFESAEVAAVKDRLAIERLLALDPRGLFSVVREKNISMCGFAPAVAALTAGLDLGASAGKLVRYSNSGEISGDFESVVGYAGLAVV